MKTTQFIFLLGITFFSLKSYTHEIEFPISEEEIELSNIAFEKQMEMAKLLSSGADIVGNGSGRIELLANYYLRQLDQTISHCLNNKSCQATKADRFVLKEIRQVVLDSRQQNKKLIFLNGDDFERIFNSNFDPDVRIAKTGFNRKHPIFFNLTELYKIDNNALDRQLIAILVHELGHQTGIKSHSYLNEVASRVSFQFEQNLHRLSLNFKNSFFELLTLHDRGPYDFAKIIMTIDEQVFEVPYLTNDFKCVDPTHSLVGINLMNSHWKKITLTEENAIIPLGFWANLYCEDPIKKETHSELISLSIQLEMIIQKTNGQNEFRLIRKIIETSEL